MFEFLEKYIVLIAITVFMLFLVFGLMWINMRKYRNTEPKTKKMRPDTTNEMYGLMNEDNFAESEAEEAELLEPREKGTIRRFIKTGEGYVSARPVTKIIVNEKREEEQPIQKRKPFYAPNTTDNSSEQ